MLLEVPPVITSLRELSGDFDTPESAQGIRTPECYVDRGALSDSRGWLPPFARPDVHRLAK